MDIELIKQEVIYTTKQNRLFEITIELVEELSGLQIDLIKTESNLTKTEIMGKISLLTTLQNIIDKRMEDVRTKEILSNRHFKIAAETVLKKETFQRIQELSLIEYRKFKEMKAELKVNKLE